MRERTGGRARPRRGFTLIELTIVIVIIGILVSFVLVVGSQGVRSAELRATQALITKLDAAMNDLLDQIGNTTPPVNAAHNYLASIPNYGKDANGNYLPMITDPQRAQTIAKIDYLRSIIPDVWYYQSSVGDYPINCGAVPYDPLGAYGANPYSALRYAPFALPMGNQVGLKFDPTLPTGSANQGAGDNNTVQPTGMFGASFEVRGALMKNLGAVAFGYDGTDNDNDFLIDEFDECYGPANPTDTASGLTVKQLMLNRLSAHQHHTARSEMLYAVLTEGVGPFGAPLSRDDFTSAEVQDTDGDGLPEFIDAWGRPLQFYLWPIGYGATIQPATSSFSTTASIAALDQQAGKLTSLQKGPIYYFGSSEPREQATLDPQQQLLNPSWWGYTPTSSSDTISYPPPPSVSALTMSNMYFPLFEWFYDKTAPISPGNSPFWDRQFLSPQRRAYYTKHLIVSSGPDQALGLSAIPDASALANLANPAQMSAWTRGVTTLTTDTTPPLAKMYMGEGYAVPLSLIIPASHYFDTYPSTVKNYQDMTGNAVYTGNHDGEDDISNQSLNATLGGS